MDPSRISVIIPAAGFSERFGEDDKLSMPWGQHTVLWTVVNEAIALAPLEIVVVTRQASQAGCWDEAANGSQIHRVVVSGHEGMGGSVAAGVRACSPQSEGFLVWPGDMPLLTAAHARAVLDSVRAGSVVRPVHHGIAGHPVFFPRALRNQLECLHHQPPRDIIDPHKLVLVGIDDPAIHQDVDTREALEALRPPPRPSSSGVAHA